MSPSLDAVKEDLKEVEEALQSEQDPVRTRDLQDEPRKLRPELRELQRIPGVCSSLEVPLLFLHKTLRCCCFCSYR